ncbi:MAG TPA: tRNA (adenosine(37)-N6)-threonylcarbamoyltransferase complex ATPase subunit type 1 TsaE [Candidatus Obscuribacterales bacterium]
MVRIFLPDAAATRELGAFLGRAVQDRAVLALVGPLGSGKTTLVQGLAAGLGVTETVSSPTFTMLNEYHSGRLPLYHLDLYRLEEDARSGSDPGGSARALFRAELEEILDQSQAVVVVEWAELGKDLLPPDHVDVQLAYADLAEPGSGRYAVFTGSGRASSSFVGRVAGFPAPAQGER